MSLKCLFESTDSKKESKLMGKKYFDLILLKYQIILWFTTESCSIYLVFG